MEKKTHQAFPRRAWIRRILFAVAAGLLLASTVLAAPASAHGAVSDPIARHYGTRRAGTCRTSPIDGLPKLPH